MVYFALQLCRCCSSVERSLCVFIVLLLLLFFVCWLFVQSVLLIFQIQCVISGCFQSFNTLATEPLWGNSTGISYTTFSIFMQYADSMHLTAPALCLYVYWLCLWGTSMTSLACQASILRDVYTSLAAIVLTNLVWYLLTQWQFRTCSKGQVIDQRTSICLHL